MTPLQWEWLRTIVIGIVGGVLAFFVVWWWA
jgi:hypothetical protein